MEVATNNNIKCTIALAALQNVLDPEIGLNVVDLGLIYGIDFDETNAVVTISMTLTTQYCPMGESISALVIKALQACFKDEQIHVSLVYDPQWNAEMISENGKNFLKR